MDTRPAWFSFISFRNGFQLKVLNEASSGMCMRIQGPLGFHVVFLNFALVATEKYPRPPPVGCGMWVGVAWFSLGRLMNSQSFSIANA